MRQVKSSLTLSFFFCLLFFAHFIFAATGVGIDNTFTPPQININEPVDNVEYLVPLAVSQPVAVGACSGSNDKLTVSAVYTATDYKTADNNYPIFKSPINGLGWTIIAKDGSATDYSAIGAAPVTLFSKNGQNGALGFFYQFQWVRYPDPDGDLKAGKTQVDLGPILNTYCYAKVNETTPHGTGELNALETTITLNALTCDVDTHALTMTIPAIDWFKLSAAPINTEYTTDGYGEDSITITCQAGILPNYTLQRRTEPSDPSSSTQIGLDPSSKASGFSLRLKRSVDNSQSLKVNNTQYLFGPEGANVSQKTTAGEVRKLNLFAVIYKTNNPIVPGPFTALVDMNITYN